MDSKWGQKGKWDRKKRIQKLLRTAKTQAENKYSLGGRLKDGSDSPKPITLAGARSPRPST